MFESKDKIIEKERYNKRAKMTLENMPNIKKLKRYYHIRDLKFYGSISYLMPLISCISNDKIV